MDRIKGFLFVLIGLFAVVTVISFFIPSKVVVRRAVSVHSDPAKIRESINDLRNWKKWHPVFKSDSLQIKDSTADHLAWISNGKENSLRVTERKDSLVKIVFERKGDNPTENNFSFISVQEQGNMQVQWEAVTHLKWYPWEKFGGIFIEKMTGQGYEDALNSLKNYLENNQ